ncbi:MAG: 2OG-Fe(II) oxygenase [Steroidobacteraceae bacterium]
MTRSISTDDAISLAKSGDADAQYALSSVLHERGQYDESLRWLRLAAAQSLIPARTTLATLLMDGLHCPRDLRRAVELLEPLAATQGQANLLLAEVFGFAAFGISDRATALRYLLSAARAGEPAALRQLALLSVCHRSWGPVRPLLDAAARRGDAFAAYALACCYAEGIGGAENAALAATLCRTEAAGSQHLNQRLIHSLGASGASPGAGPPVLSVDWRALEETLPQLGSDVALPDAETLHVAPLIRRLPRVFHHLVLDAVIHLAAPLVRRSQIVDARTGEARADPMRTSSHVTLSPPQHDHVLESLERCISRVSGLPQLNSEFLQILRYRPGEQFRPHVDYFNEGGAGTYRSLADGGQRAQTALLWLSDDYSGGSTSFPKLQLEIKGARGDMLHFHNLAPDGLGHRDSLHAGLPVMAGEKWLLSQWIRAESYPSRLKW